MKPSPRAGREITLVLGDALCLVAGLVIALVLRYGFDQPRDIFETHIVPFGLLFILWLFSFFIAGLYAIRIAKNDRQFMSRFFATFVVNAIIAIAFFYFIPFFSITPKTVLFFDVAITAALLLAWRYSFNRILPLQLLRVAIIGASLEVAELIEEMEKNPQRGYRCVLQEKSTDVDLAQIVTVHSIDVLVIEFQKLHLTKALDAVINLLPDRVEVFDFIDFVERFLERIPLSAIDSRWFVLNIRTHARPIFSFFKRCIDIGFSIVLALIGIVLAPFVAIAILVETGTPVIYSQMRMGRFQKAFRIYKFRSMGELNGRKHVTRVGHFIRATHLDEIPQLWNVLRGDMSFVGPRPETVELVTELNGKIPFYRERLWVRPGITGWAQLHQPHALAEDALKKLQYDLYYLKNRSILLDLEIMIKTLRIIIL